MCGNQVIDPGEQCDPPGSPCTGGQVCDQSCLCSAPVPACCQTMHPLLSEQLLCFDAVGCATECLLFGGECVTGACDPGDQTCKPQVPPQPTAPLCCQCPGLGGPGAPPQFCFETLDPEACTAFDPFLDCEIASAGTMCDPVTRGCS